MKYYNWSTVISTNNPYGDVPEFNPSSNDSQVQIYINNSVGYTHMELYNPVDWEHCLAFRWYILGIPSWYVLSAPRR